MGLLRIVTVAGGRVARGSTGSIGGLVLYFFVSHASGDDDQHIERFFDDLAREVRSLAPVSGTEAVGFLDTDTLKFGTRWLPPLNNALSTCGCFVALCSPKYFMSDFCGREWGVFEARMREFEQQHGYAASALLPVMWQPTTEMHPAAAAIQYRSRQLGDAYRQHGLLPLVRLKRFKADYQLFTSALARHIVDTAHSHPLPPPLFGLDSDRILSAFHPAGEPPAESPGGTVTGPAAGTHELATSAATPVGSTLPAGEADKTTPPSESSSSDGERELSSAVGQPGGPGSATPAGTVSVTNGRVHFVLAVSRPEELSKLGRRSLQFYGAEFHEWAPYRPQQNDPLAVLARSVAAERLFESEIADCEELLARIDRANQENDVVVLLVDAWAARVRRVGDVLYEYDRRNEPTTGVMVPMNIADQETVQRQIELCARLAAVFPRNVNRYGNLMFRQSVPSSEAFSEGLKEILEVARNQMFKYGTPQFDIDLPTPSSPILEGPSAEGKE